MKQVCIVERWCAIAVGVALLLFADSILAQGAYVVGWGMNAGNQASPVPTNAMSGVSSIAAGYNHSLAVKNGRVWAWGENSAGQTNVPILAESGVTNVAGGADYSLALKTDGSVVAWGGRTNLPAEVSSGVSQIAAGEYHALALKAGGIIAWGSNQVGQCTVPSSLTSGVSAISAGGAYSMALKSGGVQIFGSTENDIQVIPAEATSGVSAIAAGRWHALALKNGGVIAWGATYYDATVVPPEASSDVVAIAAGDCFSMALKTNGSVVVWGDDTKAQLPVPAFASNGVSKIAAGVGHCLVVSSLMPPRFTAFNLPIAYTNSSYAGSITAAGDPAPRYYKGLGWAPWMTLNETSGAVGGNPNVTGVFTIYAIASNAVGTVTNAYLMTVQATPVAAPVFMTTNPLPEGVMGAPYSLQFNVANNPTAITWYDAGSGLPPGLSLTTNGLLSGTPTGLYNAFFTVRATNDVGASNRFYSLRINPPPSAPVFETTNPLPSGIVGHAYSMQVVASNLPVFSLSSGSLPNGLTINSSGLISGTPTVIENPTFTLRATNIVGASTQEYSLEIFGPPVFSTTSPLPVGVKDIYYSQILVASGNPTFRVTAGSLPGGLVLYSDGVIGGTPTNLGSFNFTVTATNAYGWTNRVFDLQIAERPVFVTESPLPAGKIGTVYSNQIVVTGNSTLSVVDGSLPGGLNMATNGWLAGTPTAAGPFNFTVFATNQYGGSNHVYDLTIEDWEQPMFTSILHTNGNVRLAWVNPNTGITLRVYRATNMTDIPVNWSNFGPQVSPWTNTSPPLPSYYQLRYTP